MRGKTRLGYLHLVPVLVLLAVLTGLILYAVGHPPQLLNAAGPIAAKERNLIYFALALSLVVVIPVFTLLFSFAWRYREGAKAKNYAPELAGNRTLETIWWLIPGVLILILSIVTWNSSHALDPFKPLDSNVPPVRVQVVSLDWKWLFIYPDMNVASVNELALPAGTPIDLSLTSDAPMNSFWVPRLAGQIYTMPGMETQLHLLAYHPGHYRGQSANISGQGFASMVFDAHAMTPTNFSDWVDQAHRTGYILSMPTYDKLAEASQNVPSTLYGAVSSGLFDQVIAKYMAPSQPMAGMNMEMMQ